MIRLRMALALCLLTVAACATGQKPTSPPNQKSEPRPRSMWIGSVIRVNAEKRYVVIECAVLPRAGEEARVFRGEVAVGKVRFARQISFPYAAADVLEGEPATGDRVKE